MASYPVGVAYVGAGAYATAVLSGSVDSGRIEIRGIFDMNAEAARARADMYRCPVYYRYEDVLADPRVDAVAFSLPPHENRRYVEEAARAGKHCYVAKPIAVTVSDGRAMDTACRKAGRCLMVGHNDRRRSAVREARRIVNEGRLGQAVLFEGNISHRGGWTIPSGHWRGDRSKCPTVPLMMLGIHVLDSMISILGPATSACAIHRHAAMPSDNEDLAVQIYELASGGAAYVGDSYVSPDSNWMRIHGSKASLLVEQESLTLLDQEGKGSPVALPAKYPERELMDEFARAIVEGTAIETGAVASLRALACAEAALRSARSGRREAVEQIKG